MFPNGTTAFSPLSLSPTSVPTASITNGIQVQLLRSKLILSMHFPYLSPMENFGVVVKYGICFSGDTPDGLQVESCSAIKCAYNDPMHQNFSRRLGFMQAYRFTGQSVSEVSSCNAFGSLDYKVTLQILLTFYDSTAETTTGTLRKHFTKPTERGIFSLSIIQEQNLTQKLFGN